MQPLVIGIIVVVVLIVIAAAAYFLWPASKPDTGNNGGTKIPPSTPVTTPVTTPETSMVYGILYEDPWFSGKSYKITRMGIQPYSAFGATPGKINSIKASSGYKVRYFTKDGYVGETKGELSNIGEWAPSLSSVSAEPVA